MQQTSKYQFNLVEMDDVFSTKPLNENTEKTEAALQALESGKADLAETGQYLSSLAGRLAAVESGKANTADTANLNTRVAVLEARRVVLGNYLGDNSQERFVEFGFTPNTVLLFREASNTYTIMRLLIKGQDLMNSKGKVEGKIVENGIYVTLGVLNSSGAKYMFIAIL